MTAPQTPLAMAAATVRTGTPAGMTELFIDAHIRYPDRRALDHVTPITDALTTQIAGA